MFKNEPDMNEEFLVVGLNNEWDLEKCPTMTQLNAKGRAIYGLSFIITLPVEQFQIVDSSMGWSRRFYPKGNGSTCFSRVLEGDDEQGMEINWETTAPIGTEITIYFAPYERTVVFEPGALDLAFDMPYRSKGMTIHDVWATTHFEVVPDEPLTKLLLMTACPVAYISVGIFHLMPYAIMAMLTVWAQKTAPLQIDVALYQYNMALEWVNVSVIYIGVMLPVFFEVRNNIKQVLEVFAFASKIRDDTGFSLRLRRAVAIEIINMLQPIFALALSLYFAIFLSEDVFLNVVLNILALEFIAKLDDGVIAAFIRKRYKRTSIALSIVDIKYAVDEDHDFWHESNSSKPLVTGCLRKEISNDMRWMLLTSCSAGLGLLGRLQDGRECVSSFTIQLDAFDWYTISEEKLVEKGGLFLAGTPNMVWHHNICRTRRAMLLKHFPEIAVTKMWVGYMCVAGIGLTSSHLHFISYIVHNNQDVTDLDAACNNFGGGAIELFCEKLQYNKTLKNMSLCECGLTNRCAIALANLLRNNIALRRLYIMDNVGISDSGALTLASSLSEGNDSNYTLIGLYMKGTNVSDECQKKCRDLTNGRITFK